ncbi:tRNA (adenosine(37)-N6)-threonylcarbamoyltransferase complex dimerization subunit type 1 TsaB [Pedobacter sp. JCM 36344]|uniref:tRNA (adenosine(37)-N6)-threonylcarbamoyltransferase complex dimerization subunit type 1 TsaB n=1 Tax=Pedobacter sp. JCM 36344 TaxID=3374280 RepID=UPI00397B2D50
MALILQLETATQVCSAALSQNGNTIAVKELQANNIHAGSLTLFIKEVMEVAGFSYSDLDAIAVSKGPGSYTGLRIGVSTAKGLCFALDKPLIAIGTLGMMAKGFLRDNPDFDGLICSMIDARRMEVFTSVFDCTLTVVQDVSAKIIDEQSFLSELGQGQIMFIGDGAEKCKAAITHPNAAFSTENFNSAVNMSELSFDAFLNTRFEDLAYFEPFYLKEFLLTTPKTK